MNLANGSQKVLQVGKSMNLTSELTSPKYLELGIKNFIMEQAQRLLLVSKLSLNL
jgi:hypothetical protein